MALRIFESVFYKSLVRACSFDNSLAASQNARSYVQTIDHRTLRICKKRIQKVLMLPLLLIHDLSFSFIYIPNNRTLFKPPHRECMFYCIDNNNICLPLHKLKTNNIQHTHLHKFFNLVIIHTLDFWYMIKTKEATATLSVASLVFIIYSKSTVGQHTKFKNHLKISRPVNTTIDRGFITYSRSMRISSPS